MLDIDDQPGLPEEYRSLVDGIHDFERAGGHPPDELADRVPRFRDSLPRSHGARHSFWYSVFPHTDTNISLR